MTTLSATAELKVRFSEADMLKIVWHGHYVDYLEDGRQAFGEKYGLGYLQVYDQGFSMPIVKLNIDYKLPLKFSEKALVETTFVDTEAAKLIFHYTIRHKETGKIIATAETIQVFVDTDGMLSLTVPAFLADWKNKWLPSKN
jgi:acyl-CoA thioester hydrolase